MTPEQEIASCYVLFGALVTLFTGAAFLVVRENGPGPGLLMVLAGCFGGALGGTILGGLSLSSRLGLAGVAALTVASCAAAPDCDPFRPSAASLQARAEVPSDQLREAFSRLLQPKDN